MRPTGWDSFNTSPRPESNLIGRSRSPVRYLPQHSSAFELQSHRPIVLKVKVRKLRSPLFSLNSRGWRRAMITKNISGRFGKSVLPSSVVVDRWRPLMFVGLLDGSIRRVADGYR